MGLRLALSIRVSPCESWILVEFFWGSQCLDTCLIIFRVFLEGAPMRLMKYSSEAATIAGDSKRPTPAVHAFST